MNKQERLHKVMSLLESDNRFDFNGSANLDIAQASNAYTPDNSLETFIKFDGITYRLLSTDTSIKIGYVRGHDVPRMQDVQQRTAKGAYAPITKRTAYVAFLSWFNQYHEFYKNYLVK